ncbi:MAG: glycogen synthase [Treponema sp.]|jgi:starch synthase|nr:glycogen synthase [Treponema sp.]
MKILMASSEGHPYAKTGGLADMVSALSLSLAKLGHDVRIVLPRYYNIGRSGLHLLEGAMGVPLGGAEEWCAVYNGELPGSPAKNPVQVYFIDHEQYFGRDGIYGNPWEPDFLDNPRRFTFFSRSVFQLCRKIAWFPDILHSHDWPTAMVNVYLKFWERPLGEQGEFAKTASVLTVHNLGYQGIYGKDNFNYTGLGWDVFYNGGFEDWNMMNILKAGLYSADKLTTVSPHYAEETKTQAQGFRLDGVLRYRSADYSGILNGIDTAVWNPARDRHIPQTYTASTLAKGKARAKEALQKELGLPVDADTPLIGMITRLTDQKGVGELFGPAHGSAWAICQDMKVQLALLGSGESWCEHEVKSLAARLPNFKCHIGYGEVLAHLIEAGSDFFLMPSRYEPCGLNQMYSLAYGALPIVRNTGGLTDTVENFDQENGAGTGFMFDDLNPQAVYNTVGWAIWTWYNSRSQIEAMRLRGMKKNFSWEGSAQKYVELYKSCLRT